MREGDSTYIRRFFSVYSQEEKDKVRGLAFYPSDYLSALLPDDVAFVDVVRSPHAGASFAKVDCSEARKVKGILKVITADDIPNNLSFGSQKRDGQKILAQDQVRFRGEPVALVVGQSAECVKEAMEKIVIDWKEQRTKEEVVESIAFEKGEARGAQLEFVESNFRFPSVHSRFLEPESGWVQLSGETMTFHIGSLLSESQRLWVSKVLEIPLANIKAKESYLGGQFGGRQQRELIVFLALAAHLSKHSCRLAFRYEDQDTGSYGYAGSIKIGFDRAAKKMVSLEGSIHLDAGSYIGNAQAMLRKSLEHVASVYRFNAVRIEGKIFRTPSHPRRSLKGEGIAPILWATEQLVDQVATELDLTPLEIRQTHLREDVGSISKVYEEIEKIEKPFRLLKSDRPPAIWDAKSIQGRGLAFQSYQTQKFDSFGEVEVGVELQSSGSFVIRTSNLTLDFHVKSSLAEVAASVLRTHPKAFTVEGEMRVDYEKARKRETYPEFFYLAQATWFAANELKKKIEEAGRRVLKSDNVELKDGAVVDPSVSRKMGYRELAFTSGREDLRGRYILRATQEPHGASAGAVSRVSFHPLTGELSVDSVRVVVDAGPVIYRTGLEVEVDAAVSWVLAMLFSSRVEKDQPIPTPLDEPEDVTLITLDYPVQNYSDQPPEFFGARAAADIIVSVVLASLVNAIQNAKGISLKEIPMAPELMYPEKRTATIHMLPLRRDK